MPPNSRRIINVPVAIVTVFLRKLLDTYTGAYSNQVVLTGSLESFFRRFIRTSGSNIVLLGAAASTFIYYVKKYKVLQIVRKRVSNRRLRGSMACMTTSSLTHHPSTTQTQPSIRLLFEHPNPNIFQLPRPRIPKRRPSNLDLVGSSTFLPTPFKTSSAPCASATPRDIQSANTLLPRANSSPGNFASSSVSVTISRTSIVDCTSIAPTNDISEHSIVTFQPSARPPLNQSSTPKVQTVYNLHSVPNQYIQGRRTQLQDIHGNIYECKSMRVPREDKCACIDLDPRDSNHSSNTIGTERTLCEGDYSRYVDDVDLDMFTPSVIREILPSEMDLAPSTDLKVPSRRVRKRKFGVKQKKRRTQPKRRAPPVRNRRVVAKTCSETMTVRRRSTRLQHKREN